MDAITVLENRIEQLESKLGFSAEDDPLENSVVDQLLSADSVLSSATSGREKISEINKRLEELNSYLDPQYASQVNDAKLKSDYVLTNAPYIQNHCDSMELIKQKSSVLDSEPLSNIAALTRTLDKMKAANSENKEHCDQVEKCIEQAMETYNQVSMSVMENLANISKKIDALEKSKAK